MHRERVRPTLPHAVHHRNRAARCSHCDDRRDGGWAAAGDPTRLVGHAAGSRARRLHVGPDRIRRRGAARHAPWHHHRRRRPLPAWQRTGWQRENRRRAPWVSHRHDIGHDSRWRHHRDRGHAAAVYGAAASGEGGRGGHRARTVPALGQPRRGHGARRNAETRARDRRARCAAGGAIASRRRGHERLHGRLQRARWRERSEFSTA